MTKRGRKDIHELGTKCIKDWGKLLALNIERTHKELDEIAAKEREDAEIKRKFDEE